MDYNAFFGESGQQEAAPTGGGPSLADTWKPQGEPVNTQGPPGFFDKLTAPFQVAGGLAQGTAAFVVGGALSAVGAELATGAGVTNPLTTNNIAIMGLNAKKLFLPFMFDEEDQRSLNQRNDEWNKGADQWAKEYHAISESVSNHPLFKPSSVDNILGGGYQGSKNVQGLLGSVFTWVADEGKAAGNYVMDWAEKNPDKAKALADQGIGPDSFVKMATAVEVGVNSLPLLVPYFGTYAVEKVQGALGRLKTAHAIGDIPNTMSGRYARPENVAQPGSNIRNFFIEPTGKYVKPPIEFEKIAKGALGNDSSRPGPMPSTMEPTFRTNASGEMEMVTGENAFIRTFMKEHKGVDVDTARAAWNEYANEVTKQAYPDAYIAYEMKASGFSALGKGVQTGENPNITGRQAYLNHIFDARNQDSMYGYRNTMKLAGDEYHLKDYITYTPSEFKEATGLKGPEVPYGSGGPEAPRGPNWRPNVKAPEHTYVEYINQKSAGYGLEPVDDFNYAVKRSFELRDMEVQQLKVAQSELAWKERYFQNEIDPLVEKLKTKVSEFNGEGKTPTSPRDFRPSKEGPNYTEGQVQAFFESNAKQDIVEGHLTDILERQTRNLKDPVDSPWRGKMGRQGGYARPDVFAEGVTELAKPLGEAIEKAGNVKESVDAITKAAGAQGVNFPNRERPTFGFWGKDKLLGDKATFLDSKFGELIGATNAQEWLRKVEGKSPTLRKILDSFDRPDQGTGKAVITPYEETRKLRLAAFDEGVKNAFAPLKPSQWGPYGGLTKLQNEQLNGVLRGRIPLNKVSAEMQAVVSRLRALQDAKFEEIVKSNIPGLSDQVKYVRNYFHRSYDMGGKYHLRDKWMAVMEKYKVDKVDAERIFDNLTTHERMYRVEPRNIDAFMQDNTTVHRASSVDYERMLRNIPDAELEPFLQKNVYQTLTKYNEEWAHRQTFAERYGANGEIIRQDLAKVAGELEAAGSEFPKYAAQHVYNLVQALDNNYHQIASRQLRQAQKAIISGVNIMKLPLVTFYSAAELIMPIGTVGMKDFMKSIPSTLNITAAKIARRVMKDIPVGLREQLFKDTGAAFEASNHIALSGLAEGAVTKVDQAFYTANGLIPFTRFSKLNAINSFITHTQSVMKAAMNPKDMQSWLKKGGFNAAKAQRLTEFLDYYGIDLAKGKDWVAKGMPKEHEFYPDMVRAALRFSEDTVLTPNPATLPLWYSNPHFALVKHLKTFNSLMFTRVMKSTARNMMRHNIYYNMLYGPKVLATATGMLATGVLINQMLDYVNYGNNPLPFQKTVKSEVARGFERVGFFGPLSIVYDTIYNAKYGLGSTALGPTGGMLLEGSIDVSQWLKNGDSKTLAKFVAKNASIFGKMSGPRDAITQSVNDALQAIHPKQSNKDWRF